MQHPVAVKLHQVPEGISYTITNTMTIYNHDVTILKENGEVLAVFRKNVITDPELIKAGRNLLRYKASTRSRGMAAGINKQNKAVNPNGGLGAGNMVNSSIVGFTEANGFYKCRQTMLYGRHKKIFNDETQKLLDYVTTAYAFFAPKAFSNQKQFIESVNPHMRLANSVFTTITVNVDFQTCTHTDKGDYHSGLGNLLVFQTGKFTGGELLLPEYDIGFQIEEGDLLLFDSHEIHCNNRINGKGRISLVCYAREKIATKCPNTSPQELEQNSSIRGVDRSRKQTRKKN